MKRQILQRRPNWKIGRADFEVRVKKLKNGKTPNKDEITEKMIKGGGNKVVD